MAKEIFSFPREHKIRIFELMCNENFPKNEMVNSKVQHRCNLTSEPLGNVFVAYFEPYYIIK